MVKISGMRASFLQNEAINTFVEMFSKIRKQLIVKRGTYYSISTINLLQLFGSILRTIRASIVNHNNFIINVTVDKIMTRISSKGLSFHFQKQLLWLLGLWTLRASASKAQQRHATNVQDYSLFGECFD